jgi:hypothetical protein
MFRMVKPPTDRMTVFKAVVAAMSGKPTLIAKDPLCPPERHVELANELMEEWGIEGIAARATYSGAHIEPAAAGDEIV